jgi:mannosyltransferase
VGVDVDPGDSVRLPLGEPRTSPAAQSPSGRAAWPSFSPVTLLVAAIPGVLGFITGGYRAGVPPLWGDEGVTKAMAARSVSEILATLPHDDVVHGAYYLVVHFVTELAGSSSSAVLRFPSVVAMAVAAAFTALIAHRLATLARSPYPAITAVAAGAIFALLPFVIRYAQEARSYAIVTMLAAITTYLLLKAACVGGRWWIAYATAAGLTGLFNIFGLLILAAHGVSLLVAAGRLPRLPGLSGRRVAGVPVRWVLAGTCAVIPLIPIVAFAYQQRAALSWMSTVSSRAAINLAQTWAGSPHLVWPVFGLAAFGVAAEVALHWRRRAPLTPASVALPWLVVPPGVLLLVSQVHSVYDARYVEYCLPALAILVAWGLTWLARAVAVPLRRTGLAWLGWLVPAAIIVPLVAALLPLGAKVRLPSFRPDNLGGDSQIVAADSRPGDVVFFIPMSYRPITAAFPAQWRNVRDIALAQSPVASDTLYGIDVSPAELLKRFTHVTRVWLFSAPSNTAYLNSPRATAVDKEEESLLSRMQLLHQWRDGDKMLSLYQVRQ